MTDYQGDALFGVPMVAVGVPVAVTVKIHLGSASGDPVLDFAPAPVDGFTGTYILSTDEVKDGYAGYGWTVDPGDRANSADSAATDFGDIFVFRRGVLTSFGIGYLGDPDAHSLSETKWSFSYSYGAFEEPPPYGDGSWHITYNSTAGIGSVPEPQSWALMLSGFGLVGAALRRRVIAHRAQSSRSLQHELDHA